MHQAVSVVAQHIADKSFSEGGGSAREEFLPQREPPMPPASSPDMACGGNKAFGAFALFDYSFGTNVRGQKGERISRRQVECMRLHPSPLLIELKWRLSARCQRMVGDRAEMAIDFPTVSHR